MKKTLKLNGANKEAPPTAAEVGAEEAQPAEERETEIITADDVGHVDVSEILGAPPTDDGPHEEGAPPEKGGGESDERGPDAPEEAADKEPTLADDKKNGAVDPETGEPKDDPEMFAKALKNPSDATPEDVGAMIIKGLDRLALCMTAEVRTRQPELFQVFQLFAAERPSILERQKRLQLRQNQG